MLPGSELLQPLPVFELPLHLAEVKLIILNAKSMYYTGPWNSSFDSNMNRK